MSALRDSAKQMREMANIYLSDRTTPPKCVHRTILLRSLILLKQICPETEDFFAPIMKTFMPYAKRPDKKGDYENDMCGKFLGRAVHMISDMCCLPHTASMTYYSLGRSFHKAYELLAEAVYPDLVPEQSLDSLPEIFTSHETFADDLNRIVLETAGALPAVQTDPLSAVKEQLLRTERVVAALLLRFYKDLTEPERKAHFITNGSGCKLMKDTTPLTIKVTEKGIVLHGVNPSPESKFNVTDMVFYAAHRHNGLFTLSPAKDNDGKVLEVSNSKLVLKRFDPLHGEQLFRL